MLDVGRWETRPEIMIDIGSLLLEPMPYHSQPKHLSCESHPFDMSRIFMPSQ